MCFFCFKQKTAYELRISDWSSDVCSSDLIQMGGRASSEQIRQATLDSIRAIMLIRAYRMRGHLLADLDPLKLNKPLPHPELDPQTYGFTERDMHRPIFINYMLGLESATLSEIVSLLQATYCGKIGVEYMHIMEPDEKAWIQERIERIQIG